MPDLLVELFSEEIPARMQVKAAEDLRRIVTDKLVAEGLVYEGAKAFATPRRLSLTVHGIPARQPDLKEERKGPRVGGPDAAIQGFLKATGLASLDEAKIQREPKKGDFYIALMEKPGRPSTEVIAEILAMTIRTFPWPKSMRWGERSSRSGALQWVRPLHSIVATFGIETEEPEVITFTVNDITSGQTTRGHRFMAPDKFSVRRFDDYVAKLQAAKVVLDPERRKEIILADARQLTFAQGFELVEDPALLDEVSGLVEWPVVLMGTFDPEFLSIPDEVIRATIRINQKCFVVSDPATGRLTNKFVLTSNIEASDGGAQIIAGNERVIRARLSDAKFFYETDLRNWKSKSIDELLVKFDQIVFHEKLGTQAERIKRIVKLAGEIAPLVGADVEQAKLAAKYAKADLLTEAVGEFPELQGLMGKYYALSKGVDAAVAAASEEHYKPQGPSDRVPSDSISVAVALADKLDTLVGFWAADEKPTGSKDPFALRRAALGVIRLILDNKIRLALKDVILAQRMNALAAEENLLHADILSSLTRDSDVAKSVFADAKAANELGSDFSFDAFLDAVSRVEDVDTPPHIQKLAKVMVERAMKVEYWHTSSISDDLLGFFADRLKGQLREQGARHDLVDAVFALGGQDDLLLVVRRVEALGSFLDSDDGKNLRAGVKRASNILGIEEKKDKRAYDGAPDAGLFTLDEERALAAAIKDVAPEATAAVAREDYAGAMTALAKLRPVVDAFFDKVKVNDDDAGVRENRLKLLNEIRAATRAVADFSKIQD